ncbi:MAG: hypothetical protein VXZ82_23865 [Planctomycetota bacterium]|nr:hypothetical protein [Planctomycetota bacterium]
MQAGESTDKKRLRKAIQRHYLTGILTTLAIGLLAIKSTCDALAQQYLSLEGSGSVAGLGEPAAVIVYGSFLFVTFLTVVFWIRCVWMAVPIRRFFSWKVNNGDRDG